MKKKVKYLIIFFVAILITSINNVHALDVSKDELGTVIEDMNEDATFAYIIGEYIFTDGKPINTKDIMLAARSIKVVDTEGKTDEHSVYAEMRILYAEFEDYDENDKPIWNVENYIGTGDIPDEYTISYVDYELAQSSNEEETTKYNVVFHALGEVLETKEVEEGSTVELVTPTESSNQKFVGWYEDEEYTTLFDFEGSINKDYDLYAKYVPVVNISELLNERLNSTDLTDKEEYSVTLNEKDLVYTVANNNANINSIYKDSVLELIKNENINSIIIKGNENEYTIEEGVNETLTSANVYLTLNQFFLEETGLEASEFSLDDLIGLNFEVKFELEGDALSENDNSEETYIVQITGNKLATYTVTFNDNEETTEKTVKEGKIVSPIDGSNVPEGKEFDAWYTDREFTNKFDFDTEITSNMELYANYIYNPENITTEAGLLATIADDTVSEIILGDDIDLTARLNIYRPISIDGKGKTIKSNGATGTMLVIATDSEVTLTDVKIDGNNEVRNMSIEKGKVKLVGVEVKNGLAKNNYVSGINVTKASEVTIEDCIITDNKQDNPETAEYYQIYSTDLWVGANAKVTSTNSTVGNVFVNANSYSNSNKGFFKMNFGTISNVYVEYGNGYGAEFNYVNGTVNKLMVSTTTEGEYTTPELVREKTYIGGQE